VSKAINSCGTATAVAQQRPSLVSLRLVFSLCSPISYCHFRGVCILPGRQIPDGCKHSQFNQNYHQSLRTQVRRTESCGRRRRGDDDCRRDTPNSPGQAGARGCLSDAAACMRAGLLDLEVSKVCRRAGVRRRRRRGRWRAAAVEAADAAGVGAGAEAAAAA
jgi:hypothetical protein